MLRLCSAEWHVARWRRRWLKSGGLWKETHRGGSYQALIGGSSRRFKPGSSRMQVRRVTAHTCYLLFCIVNNPVLRSPTRSVLISDVNKIWKFILSTRPVSCVELQQLQQRLESWNRYTQAQILTTHVWHFSMYEHVRMGIFKYALTTMRNFTFVTYQIYKLLWVKQCGPYEWCMCAPYV